MKTQAVGWLMAGVLAAGLNAAYHDGGLEWAHRAAERVAGRTSAVVALAGERTDWILAEVRQITSQDEAPSAQWDAAVAQVQGKIAQSEAGYAHLEAMTARREAAWARIQADQARMQARFAARTARLSRVALVTAGPTACPRVRMNLLRMPEIKIQAPSVPQIPAVHVEISGAGPV